MKYFFILALGRSGTNFLSSLLDTDPRGVVHHEPYPLDRHLLGLRHAGGFDRVVEALLAERFETMLAQAGRAEYYGEVNSYLRYETEWLRRRFSPTLIHLVRDGRAFVRSAWVRPVLTGHAPASLIVPRDDDPCAARWGEMSRFERLCWYWTHTNRFLKDRIDRTVRFEDLIEDYDVFSREVLQPTGVTVSRERWQAEVSRPKNTSRRFRFRQWVKGRLLGRPEMTIDPLPHWSRWTDEQNRAFDEIAGDLMRELGYR